MAALVIMLQTEVDFGSRIGFVLSWGILNFLFIALLRRPALSGALSLTLVVLLVLLSRLKHDVVQMTANFVDLMVIDRDTAAFLFTIFPNLRWSVLLAALVTIPLMYALWWLDPFRIRRLPAAAGLLACLAVLSGQAKEIPVSAARQASVPASAGRRRMRNGSSHHSAYIRGRTMTAAPITDQRKPGKIVNRKAALSRSIIITSMKFAVICTTSCLSWDSRISVTTRVSDSAPDSAGRRNSAIQKKFRIPQASTKPSRAPKSFSVCSIKPVAARWGAATASSRQSPTEARPVAATAAVGTGFGAGAMDGTQHYPALPLSLDWR